LKNLCWNGIPDEYRDICWPLLLGYLPALKSRRETTLSRKREEYWSSVQQFFNVDDRSEYETIMFHQISLDVPRTNPFYALFRLDRIQLFLHRILYVWAIRHPASGYVQGINEFLTPFIFVFLRRYVEGPVEDVTDLSHIPEETINNIEADIYWCLTAFIDGIQDLFTEYQPGIQVMMLRLQEIVKKIDKTLYDYLENLSVQFVQFAFRWMNCLLMRELPIKATIRLLDTYISEDDFASFHIYMCSSFLKYWSNIIQAKQDFAQFMMFIQDLPTEQWGEEEISLLLSEAYIYKSLYHDAPGHFV